MKPITEELVKQIASTINECDIPVSPIIIPNEPMSDEVRALLDDEDQLRESIREILDILSDNAQIGRSDNQPK